MKNRRAAEAANLARAIFQRGRTVYASEFEGELRAAGYTAREIRSARSLLNVQSRPGAGSIPGHGGTRRVLHLPGHRVFEMPQGDLVNSRISEPSPAPTSEPLAGPTIVAGRRLCPSCYGPMWCYLGDILGTATCRRCGKIYEDYA